MPLTPVAHELLLRCRQLRLPRFGRIWPVRRRRAARIPAVLDLEEAYLEDYWPEMPDRVEDWPNHMMEMAHRPLPMLPGYVEESFVNDYVNLNKGYVEESLVNDYVNLNKEIILKQIPEGQPKQPQDVAAADAAVDGLDGEPRTFRRSASACMYQRKGTFLGQDGAATMHGPLRGVSRSATF